jgi:hypothetical protein
MQGGPRFDPSPGHLQQRWLCATKPMTAQRAGDIRPLAHERSPRTRRSGDFMMFRARYVYLPATNRAHRYDPAA